jgi:serine O-acetyltransferase
MHGSVDNVRILNHEQRRLSHCRKATAMEIRRACRSRRSSGKTCGRTTIFSLNRASGLWQFIGLETGEWASAGSFFGLRCPCFIVACIDSWNGPVASHLPYTVPVGRRVRIWHHSGMVLHARSIGNDVHIRQNTTFGVAHRGQNEALPVIEDGADIGCNVCVLGNVRIGAGAVVGAGSVVLTDVPPGTVAVGVPARVLPARELTDSKLTMSASASEVTSDEESVQPDRCGRHWTQ